jgi:hypothetical protein
MHSEEKRIAEIYSELAHIVLEEDQKSKREVEIKKIIEQIREREREHEWSKLQSANKRPRKRKIINTAKEKYKFEKRMNASLEI